MLSEALGYPVPVKTRKSRGGMVSNAAPRALKLHETAVLSALSPDGNIFQNITLDNGFFNFHFSSKWYISMIEETPDPAARRDIPVCESPVSPATVSRQDLRFLTAICGCTPSWTLAARQDRGNPAWLVRYTEKRLRTLESDPSAVAASPPKIQALLCLAADYPSVCQMESKRLARYLENLSEAVWEITPQNLPKAVRRCVADTLEAGWSAF